MKNEINTSLTLLKNSGLELLDAARLMRNILDSFPKASRLSPAQFCAKVIETGLRHLRSEEMSIRQGFLLYLSAKSSLRPDSLRDINYLGNRLINSNPKLAESYFSELKASDCESYLNSTFDSPSQFNKARTMLHGLFEFAVKCEWCDNNPIKRVEKRRVIESEIIPLNYSQAEKLLKNADTVKNKDCLPAVGLLLLAGIRPREVRRLRWMDIDLNEDSITVRAQCSKTGGVRHVEICPSLKRILKKHKMEDNSPICPPNWRRKWQRIRNDSGFKGCWIQDVLRHTYASYFAKRFHDLPRLQINMGHRDISLLLSRYVNMRGISSLDARAFFN